MPARRWLAVLCVLIAAAGTTAAWRIHVHTQPCWAVRQLIDFNRTTQDALKAKTYFPPAGSMDEPRVPTDADYRAWTDGLQQRADRVIEPDLAAHAHRVPDLARRFLSASEVMNDQINQQPVGAPTHLPPAAKDVEKLDREFIAELRALNQACPARSG